MTRPLSEGLNDYMSWEPPSVYTIIGGVIANQEKLLLIGGEGTWKSMISQHMSFCLATGTPWFSHPVRPTPTLVVQIEVSRAAHIRRYKSYMSTYKIALSKQDQHMLHTITSLGGFEFDKPYDRDYLDKLIGNQRELLNLKQGDPQVVIIDPIFKCISGGLCDESDVRRFLSSMDYMIMKHGCTIILNHHERKSIVTHGGVVDMGSQDTFGSRLFQIWTDNALNTRIVKHTDEADDIRLHFDKMRNAVKWTPDMFVHCRRVPTLEFSLITDTLSIDQFRPKDIDASSDEE